MTLQQQAVENCGYRPVRSRSYSVMYHENNTGQTVYVNQELQEDGALVLCGYGLRVKLVSDGSAVAWINEGDMTQDIIDTAPTVMQIAAEYNRLQEEATSA